MSGLAGGVTRSFTYSATGNVTVDDLGGSATTLTYNSLDRLVQVSAGGIPLVDYVYAATGPLVPSTTIRPAQRRDATMTMRRPYGGSVI